MLAFTSRPELPMERARSLARVNSLLGGVASDESWALSQAIILAASKELGAPL